MTLQFPNFLLDRERGFAAAIAVSPRAVVNFLTIVELRPGPRRAVSTAHSLEAEVAGEVLEEDPEEAPEEIDVGGVVIEVEGPHLAEVAMPES